MTNQNRRQATIAYAVVLLLAGGLAVPVTSARAHGEETPGQAPAREQAVPVAAAAPAMGQGAAAARGHRPDQDQSNPRSGFD